MWFDRTASSGLLAPQQAFLPTCTLCRVRRACASSSLDDEVRYRSLQAANLDAFETRTTGKWPWVFKHPGRCVDLPAEEVFSGFDGLLLDDVSDTDSGDDQAYSKVRV